MKKLIKFILLPMMFLMFLTPVVCGADSSKAQFDEEVTTETSSNQSTGDEISINASDVPNLFDKLARWLYTFILVLSVFFGLYAAFLYLTGNPKNVEKAHKQLIYAFVGVIVAILSFSIKAIITSIIK